MLILAQQSGLNYDAASAAAVALRATLLPATYAFCVFGWAEAAWRERGDGRSMVYYFVFVALIVILASGFPAGITYLQTAINGMMDSHNEHVNNLFYQMLNANLGETPSVWDVANYVLYGAVKLLQGVGRFGIIIIELIQSLSLLALVGISPILIGMLATSWTRSAGVRFLMMSLIICMWQIGISLVDLVLFSLGQYIFAAAIGAGGAAAIGAMGAGAAAGLTLTTLAMPALLLLMTVAALVPIALYLGIPLIMGSVFLGANPITAALSAGAGLAATGMATVTASSARTIATAGGMASRASAAAASGPNGGNGSSSAHPHIAPPVQTATPPSDPSGGESAPGSGVVRQASGAYAAASGARHTSVPPGHQAEAPGGGMSSSQLDSGTFSVTTSSGASQDFYREHRKPTNVSSGLQQHDLHPSPHPRMKSKEQIRKETAERRKREDRARMQEHRDIIAGIRHPGGLLMTETERWNSLHPDDPR